MRERSEKADFEDRTESFERVRVDLIESADEGRGSE
jgi:hypothetical protein